MAKDLLGAVRAAVLGRGLIPGGAGVVVGVSGGVDSVVLLDVLARLAAGQRWRLVVAHLDHGLRADSEADARAVEALAEERGLPARVRRLDVAAEAAAGGEGIEEAGRRLRYRFFAEVLWDEGADVVATAHTATDQAETVLLRLLRGAGVDGLAGIPMRRPLGDSGGHVVRPLLGVGREDVEAYARVRELTWHHDPSNEDAAFTRNRVRAELVPLLRTFNPRIDEALARAAGHLADDRAALAVLDEDLVAACVEDGALLAAALGGLAPPLRSRVVRRFLQSLRPGNQPPPAHEVLAVASRLRPDGEGWALHLSEGVQVFAEAGRLRAVPADVASPQRTEAETVIDPTGTTEVPGLGIRLSWSGEGDPLRLSLDVGQGLTVGPPQPGDRLRPVGLGGTKKLSDLLIDRKVAARARPRVPVIRGSASVLVVLPPGGGPPLAVDESVAPSGDHVTLHVSRL